MGTNYYHTIKSNECSHCGRADEETEHIGKSSVGWCFSLHVVPEKGLDSLEDWRKRWLEEGGEIKDEYGDTVTSEEMVRIITDREFHTVKPLSPADMYANHGAPGPNGLMRHRTAVPGPGTWDLCTGSFS